MNTFKFCAMAVLSLGLLVGLGMRGTAEDKKDEKPKYTIKEVMKKAHDPKTGGLLKKIVGGKGDKDDKKELVALYTALGQNKPPVGADDEWMKTTKAMLEAAKEVAADKEGSVDKLKKSINCMGCHKIFRK